MKRLIGKARTDTRTKNLVQRLRAGEIAVIDHVDIDELAAWALLEKGVLAVLDCSEAVTGRYPVRGPKVLLDGGAHVIDCMGPGFMNVVCEGDCLEVRGNAVSRNGEFLGSGRLVDRTCLDEVLRRAEEDMVQRLDEFFRNTLERAEGESRAILEWPPPIDLGTRIRGRHVLVVVRGRGYREDLRTVMPYVRELRPVLVGVDGGADALLSEGLKPHIIIGDMDSVSDMALRSGAELVVHAYPDGTAPGLGRLRAMGLSSHCLPCPGTSEDAALLLVHSLGARLIAAVGTHFDFIDFLEKGRAGMASTLLVRMKVGPILVDAKGVSQLYQARLRPSLVLGTALAAALPLAAVGLSSPSLHNLLRLLFLRVRVVLGF